MAFISFIRRPYLQNIRNLTVGLGLGCLCTLSLSILYPRAALSASKIKFTYGPFGQSLTIQELKTLAETGKASSKLKFFLNAANQNPENAQRFLSQEIKISLKLADQVLYRLPGEYALFQAGLIFQTPSEVANIQALRAGVIQSLSDDSRISLVEFLEKYPLSEMTIDGLRLARTAGQIERFVGRLAPSVESGAAIATGLLESLVCDCQSPNRQQELRFPTTTPTPEEANPDNASSSG